MKFPSLIDYPVVCLDTETSGLSWWKDRIFAVSLTVGEPGDLRDFYYDIRRTPEAVHWLRDQIPRVRKLVAHNAKYDWHFSREIGIHFPAARTECTMIRAALIDEHRMTYDLDSLGKDCFGVGKDETIWQELAALFGGKATKDAQIGNLPRAPVELAGRYAMRDANTGMRLWWWQEEEIARQGLEKVHALECQLLPVIVRMERGGVRVDIERAAKAADDIDIVARREQIALDRTAGFPVNPNPSGSIHRLFEPREETTPDGGRVWRLNDGTIALSTDAGKASIDADCLRAMKHPAAKMILNLRKMIKARDTFLRGHVLNNHHNGIIHANYNQTKNDTGQGTGSGRFSVNSPALQQIHKRDEDIASIVRAVFVGDDEQVWVCNDWAQMDFRVFAHYLQDPTITERYRVDPATDFHQIAADMTGLPRKPRFAGDPNAKQINLGLIFGMGQGTMAEEMGLPYTIESNGRGGVWKKPGPEAEAVFHTYHSAIPGVKDLLQDASSVAKSRGFVRTIMGRHIRFPRKMFVHKAGGLIFQGSAADALKVKIIELDDYFQSLPGGTARLILNVHDEFDSSVEPDRPDVLAEINRILTAFGPDDRIHFRVPVLTDQGVGDNWWLASR